LVYQYGKYQEFLSLIYLVSFLILKFYLNIHYKFFPYDDPYADDDIIIVYHIAATTVDEAVDLWIENYSDITWKDKTREDFTRKDYWDAWVDHNREKTYNVYLNKISKENTRR
jgi:hypothetical protein